jgi:hypothetical protein
MTEQLTNNLFQIRNDVRGLGTLEAETVADFYMNYEEMLKKGSDAQVITTITQSIHRMEQALKAIKDGMSGINR